MRTLEKAFKLHYHRHIRKKLFISNDSKKERTCIIIFRGGGTGEAGEATASPEFRGFTTEKFLASWMYERGNFSCFTGKKLVVLLLVRK